MNGKLHTPAWAAQYAGIYPDLLQGLAELAEAGRLAAQKGMMCGFNSNISCRLAKAAGRNGQTGQHETAGQSGTGGQAITDDALLITVSGVAKGRLGPEDFALLRLADMSPLAGGGASSESRMHQEIFLRGPEARFVLHCHPPRLLALSLRLPDESMAQALALPLYEAEAMRARLGQVPPLAPGSAELAARVGQAAAKHEAVWMSGHGLTVWAAEIKANGPALALAEELEHLAGIKLLTLL